MVHNFPDGPGGGGDQDQVDSQQKTSRRASPGDPAWFLEMGQFVGADSRKLIIIEDREGSIAHPKSLSPVNSCVSADYCQSDGGDRQVKTGIRVQTHENAMTS